MTVNPPQNTPFAALVQSVTASMQRQLETQHNRTIESVAALLRSPRDTSEFVPVSARLGDLHDLIANAVPTELEKELADVRRERELLREGLCELEHTRAVLEVHEADVYKRKRSLRRFSDMVAQGGLS